MFQARSLTLRATGCIAVLCFGFGQMLAFGQSTSTLTCPAGQTKTIVPTSPVCILRANVKGVQDTDFTLTGYDHLVGNCTLSAVIPQAPQTASTEISVTAGLQRTAWAQSSPWPFQLDPLLTCPSGAVKKSCAFTSGAGPLGEIVCACYPAGVTPPATVQEPTYACVANGCAEGQYWCSAESVCKSAGASCGTVTCNNNNICETGESCNCGDCTNGGTDDTDRCGLTATGAQMVCTKDIVTSTTASSTPPANNTLSLSCTVRRRGGVQSSTVECNAGEVRVGGGCGGDWNGGSGGYRNFPLRGGAGPTAGFPAVTNDGWACSPLGGEGATAFAVCCTDTGEGTTTIRESSGIQQAQVECSAGETRIGGGCDSIHSNIPSTNRRFLSLPLQVGEDPLGAAAPTALRDGWVCDYGVGFNKTVTAYALCRSSTTTTPLSVVSVKKGADKAGVVSCDAGQKLIGGGHDSLPPSGPWVVIPLYTGDSLHGPLTASHGHTATADEYFIDVSGWEFLGQNATAYALCASNQVNSTTTTSSSFDPTVAQTNFNTVNTKLASYLSSPGNLNLAAGEFGAVGPELQITQDTRLTPVATSFTKEEAWTRTKELLSIPASATVIWSTASVKYENDVLGDNERYLYSYVIQQTSGVQKQIFFATEFLPGYGWTKVYVISKNYPLPVVSSGAQVCQNFVDPVLFGNALAQYRSPAQFCLEQGFQSTNTIINTTQFVGWLTQWNAAGTGWEPNQNGVKIDEIRCCGIPGVSTPPVAAQVGACCPTGSQWSSVANACVGGKCGEGKYYCSSESICKPAGVTCGTVTCNNNSVCDVNESCNCADCNNVADHCGLDTIGQQMICTKDTAPTCYTDKFPYCLPACLNGATYDKTTGQCVSQVSSTPFPLSCTNRSVAGANTAIATCQTNEVLAGGGCTNTSGGAYFLGGFPIQSGESWQTYAPTYDPTYWHSLEYPATPGGPIVATANGYACATGYSATNVTATAVCCTAPAGETTIIRKGSVMAGSSLAQCNAGEVRVGGGCRYVSGGSYFRAGYPIKKGETYSGLTPAQDGFVCVGDIGTQIEARAICRPAHTGETITVRKGAVNAIAECNNGEVLTGGGCESIGGLYYYIGTPIKSGSLNPYTNLTATYDGYICASGASGTSSQSFAICATNVADVPVAAATPSCQNITYPIRDDGFVKDNAASVTKYCTEKGFTSGSVLSSDANGARKAIWSGTAWTFSGDTSSYSKEITCCGGNVPAPTCQNYKPPLKSGSALHIAPSSLTKFCSEKGFSWAAMVSQAYTGGTMAYWTGTSWAGDTAGYYATELNCCNAPTASVTPSSCRNFTYPTLNDNYITGDASSATQFCTTKGYTSGTLIAPGNIGSITNIAQEVKCCGGNVNVSCQNYPNPAIGGGLVIVRSTSTAQFCREKGFTEPFMKTWAMVGTVAIWNGTAWYGDEVGGGATSLDCCTLTSAPVTPSAPITTTPPVTQLGACCPPGSAWNSTENRCVPTTCGEGQFYCSAQKKCLAGGTTCDTAVCNNDGVCSGEESCQCGDCVDGPTQTDPAKKADDKDKCSIIGGVQAMCSDDNLSDGKPGACCLAPKKWNSTANGGAGACVECNNTQAPSELQANFDQPYITCTGNGDSTKTHFRYKITNLTNPAQAPFVSDITPLNTSVLHPTLPKADYRVECFYGTAANVDTSTSSTPDSCVKTMSVKDAAQGCSRIYGYKGSTLSNEMTSPDPFDASFRCGSRLPVTDVTSTVTNPYILRFGTQNPAFLQYDSIMSLLFNEITVGPVSTQTDSYNIPTGSTNVSCAVKVGNGYSTNNSCNIRACAGGECSIPQTFSVVNSSNALCTTNDDDDYSIGCNPDAPQTARDACVKWFQDTFTARTNTSNNSFTLPFVINNIVRSIQCTKYAAGTLPGGLNMYDDFVCTTRLPNGQTVELFSGDRSLQTTAYTVRKDRDKPDISEVKYFTDDTRSTIIADLTQWQRKNVFAEVTCIDRPLDESAACACAPMVDPSTTDRASWSAGIPDVTLGGDIMRYTRTISSSVSGQTVRVVDTANNQSTTRTVSLSVDTQAPVITITDSGAANNKTVIINATDGLSKIWKTTIAPSASINSGGIIYKKVPKASADTALFDDNCGLISPLYASVSDNSAQATTQATITGVNLSNDIIVYCTQDNAGNVTKGIYPSDAVSCFSATNMPSVPNLSTYKTSLPTRLLAGQFGYSLSEDTTNAACFRGVLSSNIATLIMNQYTPSGLTTLDWAQPAKLKNTNTPNTNGYYYFATTNNTVTLPATNPTGTGQKVVIVDGGNIQINSNIDYTGADKSLIIVARKINSNGGNIYINPSVTHIDAILIADGALMNGTTNTTSNTTSTTTIKNWIDDALELSNRLTINGRLYSFNTRGGSMNTDLTPLTTNGKYFDQTTLRTNGTPAQAAAQDLEGFRRIKPDGNNTCSTNITYRVFTTSTLPPLLQRPVGYGGGGCAF